MDLDKQLVIQVLTNLSCNLDCSYCYEKNKNGRSNDIDSIISYVKGMIDNNPDKELYMLEFVGGESFLVTKLMDKVCSFTISYIASMNKKQKLVIGISTNGTLLNRNDVRAFIVKYKRFLQLGISIDGNKEKHDKNRVYHNGLGSYDDVVANLPWVFDIINKVGVKATYTVDEINTQGDDIINLIRLGFKTISSNVIYEDVVTPEHGLIVAREFIKVADYLIDNNLENQIEVTQLSQDLDFIRYYNQGLLDLVKKSTESKPTRNYCGSCKHMKCIGFDDKVYGCNRFCTMNKDGMEIGIAKNGEVEITNQPFIDEVAEQYNTVPGKCQKCLLSDYCPRCAGVPYETGVPQGDGMCGFTMGIAIARFYMCCKLWRKEHPEEI